MLLPERDSDRSADKQVHGDVVATTRLESIPTHSSV